ASGVSSVVLKARDEVFDVEHALRVEHIDPTVFAAVLNRGARAELLQPVHVEAGNGRVDLFLRPLDGEGHELMHGPQNVNRLVELASALTVEGGPDDLDHRHSTEQVGLPGEYDHLPLGWIVLGEIHNGM